MKKFLLGSCAAMFLTAVIGCGGEASTPPADPPSDPVTDPAAGSDTTPDAGDAGDSGDGGEDAGDGATE